MNNQDQKNKKTSSPANEEQEIGANGNEDKEYVQQYQNNEAPAGNKNDTATRADNQDTAARSKEDKLRDERLGGSERGGGGGSA